MSDLTETFIQEIEHALNGEHFLLEDFSIRTADYTNYVGLNIKYLYLPQYRFEGKIFKDQGKFNVEFIPGKITLTVKKDNLLKYEFLSAIHEWLNNTYSEMTKTPIERKVKEHDEILKSWQEKIHSMGEEGDHFFTKEEGEELRKKLNELEELLKNEIIENQENKNTQKQDLDKLQSEVNTLREHSKVLSKKNWFLSFSVRFFMWIKRNPGMTRRLAGFSRELLPEDVKDIVSQEALDQLLPPSNLEIVSDTESE
ncbi:polyhydroxyalkanoate synthesis regulator phasin [Lysinibacillus parviboronicapiens]|uniref:Polyhydroxyalkanoate synthesis regulator phasin n=1 Tax=Lysinibacillus parviboronicapiens TaxID=436516 RepID=A0ABV2PKV4_9BACI